MATAAIAVLLSLFSCRILCHVAIYRVHRFFHMDHLDLWSQHTPNYDGCPIFPGRPTCRLIIMSLSFFFVFIALSALWQLTLGTSAQEEEEYLCKCHIGQM